MQEALQKISVIIPVYNVEKYLPQCLESVCGQTYRELEIILVDDGSADRSGEICDEWSRKDPRIKVIHKKNGGVSSARNEGLKAASGTLIGFVDSDDWLEPGMYETLLKALGDSDMACCGYIDYPLDSMTVSVKRGVSHSGTCGVLQAALYIYEKNGCFTSVWNKLYCRSALMDSGTFIKMDTSFSWGEDEVWLARVLENCRKVSFVPEALYHWRPTEISATRNNCVTGRQMTLLKAKEQAMKILPQERRLQILVRARMFNDCYSLKVRSYCSKDWEKFRTISNTLKKMKHAWMISGDPSLIRKIKVQLLEAEMMMKVPGNLVMLTNIICRYGVKNGKNK